MSRAAFVAGDPALDFLNSIWSPAESVVDLIGSGEGLLAWLEQADSVPAKSLEAVREHAMPDELESVAAQARSLRAWFRGFVDAHKGRKLTADDLEALGPLNRLLQRDESYKTIVAMGGGLELALVRRWRTPESLLLPIGEAMARLVCEVDFTDVKVCEGQGCTRVFVDATPRRARRWCSMSVCGNRAKQAAHRFRAAMR